MDQTITAQEAAGLLGVSNVTIKKWCDSIFPGEPLRDSHGRRRISQEQLKILETVKALRADDKGLTTITRLIGPVKFTDNSPEDQSQSDRKSDDFQPQAIDLDAITQGITQQVTATVVSTLHANTELAEKYARAAHQIGGLEQQVAHLTQQLQQAQERIKLLEAPTSGKSTPWWRLW